MSPHNATYTEAIRAFEWMTGYWGGFIPLRLGSWRDDECMWRQAPRSDLPEVITWLDQHHDEEILIGLPQAKPFNGGVGQCSVLWARISGNDQLKRARAFRPLPSLVLQEGAGSSRLLIWALERPVSWPEAVAANKRIAYRLKAVQKWSNPDSLWVNAPGTFLREGRSRPAPVRVARLTTASYHAIDLVGALPDPPEVNWFEKRAA